MGKTKIPVSKDVIAAALEKTAAYLRDGKTDVWVGISKNVDLHFLADDDGITAVLYPVFNGATAVDYSLTLLRLPAAPALKKVHQAYAAPINMDEYEEEDPSEYEDYMGAAWGWLKEKK